MASIDTIQAALEQALESAVAAAESPHGPSLLARAYPRRFSWGCPDSTPARALCIEGLWQ